VHPKQYLRDAVICRRQPQSKNLTGLKTFAETVTGEYIIPEIGKARVEKQPHEQDTAKNMLNSLKEELSINEKFRISYLILLSIQHHLKAHFSRVVSASVLSP